MSHTNRIAAIAVLLSVAAVANAADEKSKPRDEGRICTLETAVGSHMPKRVCTTAAEREATRQASQQHMSGMQGYANRTSISGSGR
jgi:hypothetical protein